MSNRRSRKKRSRGFLQRRRKVILEISAAAVTAIILFWVLFYVNSIEVVGNSGKNYTDQEIIEMSIPEFWTRNSAILQIFRRKIDLTDVLFMENVEVEVTGRNAVRLHVNEKKPVGFVRLGETDFYFDHEGIVLAVMSAEETAVLQQEAQEIEESESLEEVTEEENLVQEFSPDLADVPMITGLEVSGVDVGEQLPLDDLSFFNTIQFLTKMLDKYELQPDYVEITENANGAREMTLIFDSVRADLGTDSDLEEKVTRLAAILPKLSGRRGTLHLEEFSSDTINIVFAEDS